MVIFRFSIEQMAIGGLLTISLTLRSMISDNEEIICAIQGNMEAFLTIDSKYDGDTVLFGRCLFSSREKLGQYVSGRAGHGYKVTVISLGPLLAPLRELVKN